MATRLPAGVRRTLRTDPPRRAAAARLRDSRRLGGPPDLARELGADSRALEAAREPLEVRGRPAPVLCPVCRPEPPPRAVPARSWPSPKPDEPAATASPAVADRTAPQHSKARSAARRRASTTARLSEGGRPRVSARTRAVSSLSAPMARTFSRNSYIRAGASPRVRPPSLAAFPSPCGGSLPGARAGFRDRPIENRSTPGDARA